MEEVKKQRKADQVVLCTPRENSAFLCPQAACLPSPGPASSSPGESSDDVKVSMCLNCAGSCTFPVCVWHSIKPGDNQGLQGAACEVVVPEGTSVLPSLSPQQAAPLLLQAVPGLQGFRRKFNSPIEITSKDHGSACGMGGHVGGRAGLWGRLGPLSLHPVAYLH